MSGKIKDSWILDLGCSHHVIGKKDFLTNLHSIPPNIIEIPNGNEAVACKKGSACVGPNLKIHNILFMPYIKCNLISLGEL